MKELISLFKQHTGESTPSIEALPSSGSNRRYYRLTSGDISLIGVYGQSKEENNAFIELANIPFSFIFLNILLTFRASNFTTPS